MQRRTHSADGVKAIPVRRARAALLAALLAVSIVVAGGVSASAQIPSGLAGDQGNSQSGAGDAVGAGSLSIDSGRDLADETSSQPAPGGEAEIPTLSSDEIIGILEQNPDVLTEMKAQLADRMQQAGLQMDPSDIPDQTLYSQIARSPSLRASITVVLRARGLVTDEDLQTAESNGRSEAVPGTAQSQDLLLSPGAADVRAGDFSGTRMRGGMADATEATGREALPLPISSGPGRLSAMGNLRAGERANVSTDLPVVLHQPAPFDLESLRDLYAQIPGGTEHLQRFGSDMFVDHAVSATGRGLTGRDAPLDVPVGPDYVIGAGDMLTIEMWGSVTQSFTRTVDRDGQVFLPEAGAVQIAGLTLDKAQSLIGETLKQQYRSAEVAVTVSELRSVRVYVVGDVQRPGAYDISSLATPLSALYAAGGPTAAGSLRLLMHYRGKQLVEEVDLYDFLLHGVRNGSARFESGDTLLVPPSGPQVAVSGAVKRPAIYELKPGESTLGTVIGDAEGFTAAASLSNIRIDRIDAHQQRVTVTVAEGAPDPPGDPDPVSAFAVKDGDRIRVEPILPYSQRAIYLSGHVVRPGRVAYSDGMRLSDVIHSYQDLLPEPAARGEIVRLVPPDLHATTIDFNVPDVLIGNANVDLQPFDTIRIFGRYQVDAPTVSIRGEVLRPGTYPLSAGLTVAQLVRMAGGFKRDALLDSADLTSYEVQSGNQVSEHVATVAIGAAVSGTNPGADVVLKPGDILAIHQIANWTDIGESVTIEGQVRFPGSYGFHDGERLSSVLRRAGGFLPTAYPEGAVLVRDQVKALEQSSRDELVRQIETNSAAARLSPSLAGGNGAATLQLIKEQEDQVLADLKSHPPSGRMVIQITANIDAWANTPADIELRRGDALTIPKQPGFVLVTGQVYNSTALTYLPGKTAGWYLSGAGGANAAANRKEIFIIRANGSVVGRRSGEWLQGDVLSTTLGPGDVVVVPQKIIGGSVLWRNLLTSGQLAASVAITAGVAAAAL